jgi:carboxypeptidase C (cathepsin A)
VATANRNSVHSRMIRCRPQLGLANGYYDTVTAFFQTILNFEKMPVGSAHVRENLMIHNYPSGHMVYLDDRSRRVL